MSKEFGELEKYYESIKDCKCQTWARGDYHSGFLSLHHAGCEKYDVEKEIRLMSQRIMKLQVELEKERAVVDRIAKQYLNKEEADNDIWKDCSCAFQFGYESTVKLARQRQKEREE